MLNWGRGVKSRLLFSKFAIVLVLSLFLIIFTQNVQAFGIATPYLPDNTIILEPGQYYEYEINIQNADDMAFKIEFEYNSTYNIATLRESDYSIEEKSYENAFVFEIKIPEEAIQGEEYELYFRAKPIVEIEGQVPINLEIKRDVKILVVDEDGLGYKKSIFRTIKIFFKNLNRNRFWKIVWPIILIIAFVAAIIYLAKRIWGFSSIFSSKMLNRKEKHKPAQRRSSYTISEAKSVHELTLLIEKMTEQQFAILEIKNLLSAQLKKLKENFLSEKVKKVKSKQEMLKILK